MKKANKLFLFSFLAISLLSLTSAISVDYYFHPECGHCQKIQPFMQNTINNYQNVNWNLLDTSKNQYDVSGTPYLEITTSDGRRISLSGSGDIPSYLECELKEQSNINCPTYPANQCQIGTWFIR